MELSPEGERYLWLDVSRMQVFRVLGCWFILVWMVWSFLFWNRTYWLYAGFEHVKQYARSVKGKRLLWRIWSLDFVIAFPTFPIGSMYGIYAHIGGILMGSMLPYMAYMDPMGFPTYVVLGTVHEKWRGLYNPSEFRWLVRDLNGFNRTVLNGTTYVSIWHVFVNSWWMLRLPKM
jgi:hypothetical protein